MTDAFSEHRPLLFSIAYRMLGSASGADDALQEAWLRWDRSDDVERPRAWLSTVVTRICLDELKSARARRERYVGPWLPEPLLEDAYAAQVDRPALYESLSMAFLVLLERLTPKQRAAFLLREVFEQDYDQIADILQTGEVNARQLVRRARQHVDAERPRFEVDEERREQLVGRFAAACMTGDLSALTATLAQDVEFWSDSDGRATAARTIITGAKSVARLMLGLWKMNQETGASVERHSVNGHPGLISREAGVVTSVVVFEIADGRVVAIRSMRNPDKLTRI